MSGSPAADVAGCLRPRSGRNAVVAVGNPLRGDDGVGPYIASRIAPREGLVVFDAGANPENCLDGLLALNPSYVLFLDAADFGGEPGQAREIGREEAPACAASTHSFPLRVIWEIVARDTGAEVRCVGIQPLDCGYREGLSAAVLATADQLIGLFSNI